MASSGSSDITKSSEGSRGWRSREGKKKVPRKGKNPEQNKQRQKTKAIAPETMCFLLESGATTRIPEKLIHNSGRANGVLSYFQLGDEGLSSEGSKLNSIFITAEIPHFLYLLDRWPCGLLKGRIIPLTDLGRSIFPAGKEVDIGLDGGRDKTLCPADMLLYSWDGRLDVCVDLTRSSPLKETGMVEFLPGQAVIDAAQRKRGKYMDRCATIRYRFLPFSFSSLGELEAHAVTLLSASGSSL
ncbi:zf-CCHC domain-containing protein [Tanacetum coccineum]